MPEPPSLPEEGSISPRFAMESQTPLQSRPDEHIISIPLTPSRTNVNSGDYRQDMESDPLNQDILRQETGLDTLGQRSTGRRRLRGPGKNEDRTLTRVGRFYEKLLNFSILTRYILYIFPLSAILTIPTLSGTFGPGKDTTIGGVRMVWFFLWIQIIWISLWVSKLFAKALPSMFQVAVGVVSSGVKKYATVIRALELPISLVGWATTCLTSFTPIMTHNPDKLANGDTSIKPWMAHMNGVLGSCLVSSLVYLGEKVFVQLVSVNYHRKQFEDRIKENKHHVILLSHLYEASRKLFPDYTEFAEEDCIIHQGLASTIFVPAKGNKKGAITQMRQLVGNLNVVGNKVTSVFGNVAREVTGKNVFNPNSAYSIVLEVLLRKDSAEALAKRIWMSFVAEDSDVLKSEDLVEVMGSDKENIALECSAMLDKDGNGDISLEEMVSAVHLVHTERRYIFQSMQDVDNAIGVLDNVLSTVVFIIIVFIFVAFNFSNFSTMLAAAGTVLLSLSFIFAITAQEMLGSCIFLFVKHPYDVGDRVDINEVKFIVQHISLLYTVFRRCDNGKTTQVPNNILNTQWIENISRSKNMQETIIISIHYDTSFDDIQALKDEMSRFIKENGRDYRPQFDIEITGVNNLDKLDIKLQIMHKGNMANEELATQRRNKFICALRKAMKKIPIHAPGGGDPYLGEEGKPMYTVAITNEDAQRKMKSAAKAKMRKRWDYQSPDSDDDDDMQNTKFSEQRPGIFSRGIDSRKEPTTSSRFTNTFVLDNNSTSHILSPVQEASPTSTDFDQSNVTLTENSRRRSVRSVRTVDSRLHGPEQGKDSLHRGITRGRRKTGATLSDSPYDLTPLPSPVPYNTATGSDNHSASQTISTNYIQQPLFSKPLPPQLSNINVKNQH
ncbi:Mechanosensitive ion channel-domain-containing protein [Kalaharituber pfeilii]|nr:Mechanosensitive ion channel-domain-containing protein [Kalaharituber pfeilii]